MHSFVGKTTTNNNQQLCASKRKRWGCVGLRGETPPFFSCSFLMFFFCSFCWACVVLCCRPVVPLPFVCVCVSVCVCVCVCVCACVCVFDLVYYLTDARSGCSLDLHCHLWCVVFCCRCCCCCCFFVFFLLLLFFVWLLCLFSNGCCGNTATRKNNQSKQAKEL